MHTVADVHCLGCNDRLGWYYLKAANHTQKYKEGGPTVFIIMRSASKISAEKYMLEREKLIKDNAWELNALNPSSSTP